MRAAIPKRGRACPSVRAGVTLANASLTGADGQSCWYDSSGAQSCTTTPGDVNSIFMAAASLEVTGALRLTRSFNLLCGGSYDHVFAADASAETGRSSSRESRSPPIDGRYLGAQLWFGIGGYLWVLIDEPELHLGDDVLVPDIAGWRRERMPEIPDVAAFELAPDWVCEVLSPSAAAIDRGEKLPIFARERVAHAWLVDPVVKTVEVLRLDGETHRLVGTSHDEVRVRAEPFDAIELDLATLWAR